MKETNISAWPREEFGKESVGRLRKTGFVPAVLYGPGVDKNLYLKLRSKDVEKILSTRGRGATLLSLAIEGDGSKTVMFKTLQRDPVKDTLQHIDLINVLMDRKVTADVPVVIVGRAEGIAHGGIVQQVARRLKIECLPASMPASIEVDVTLLGIGHSIQVEDIKPPEGVRIKDDEGVTVVLVSAPVAEEVVAKPAAEVLAEAAAPAEGEAAEEGKAEKPEKGKAEKPGKGKKE